ncbi:MAG TPA: hypothetical protein VJ180_03690 [Pyrinomonadaceae bacterium]|nr:hypothetical protein [Pyrinomonadaceae bacterium]
MSPGNLWLFLPLGYLLTISIEIPILLSGLSRRHSWTRKILAGVWLTACTYPVVTLVLPLILRDYSRSVYLIVAEVFAPVTECILFFMAFGESTDSRKTSRWRDFSAIVVANLASFAAGEFLKVYSWFGLLD